MDPPERAGKGRRLLPWAIRLAAVSAAYTLGGEVAGWASALCHRRDLPELVALTFDDGPNPDATPAILDCLAEHGVPATFFMVGRRAAQHAGLAREVVARGHEVGNHTYSHRNQWLLSPWGAAREIRRGSDAISQACGCTPLAFRAPWGMFTPATLHAAHQIGQRSVLWSVRSEGLIWHPTVDEMVSHILSRTRGGDIINLHDAGGFRDTPQRVLAALGRIVPRLREAGFRLAPLSAFLSPPALSTRGRPSREVLPPGQGTSALRESLPGTHTATVSPT